MKECIYVFVEGVQPMSQPHRVTSGLSMKETPMKTVVFNLNRALASLRQTERPSTHHISEAKLVRMCLQLCGYRHRDYSAHRVCWNYAQSVFDVVAFENVYSPKTECGCPSGGGIKNGRMSEAGLCH